MNLHDDRIKLGSTILSKGNFMTNRIVFTLALLGMILTLHMWMQKERGFEAGCLGMSAGRAQVATVSGCQEAMESESSSLWGVDNIIIGFLFYVAIACLSIGEIFASIASRRLLTILKLGMSGVGVTVSLYLLYLLFFQLNAGCPLCLGSAFLVATIFVIEMVAIRRKKPASAPGDAQAVVLELGFVTLASFVAGAMLIVDLVFLNNVLATDLLSETNRSKIRSVANAVLDDRIDASFLQRMAPCAIDDSKPAVDWESMIVQGDPFLGNPNAAVTVVELFDPNCSHCKLVHPVIKQVVDRYRDRVRFFIKPYAIWPKSFSQIEALWFSVEAGKYFDMIDLQFRSQVPQGLPLEALSLMAASLGLDTVRFERALQQQEYRQKVIRDKELVNAVGITAAPTVLLNGKFVGRRGQTLTVECISKLIDQELQANDS